METDLGLTSGFEGGRFGWELSTLLKRLKKCMTLQQRNILEILHVDKILCIIQTKA